MCASTLTALPVLRPGATGAPVRTLQALLLARGEDVRVDGEFGAATHLHVAAFQIARGLEPDGVVGLSTWHHLLDIGAP